jgi:hypothetical protein
MHQKMIYDSNIVIINKGIILVVITMSLFGLNVLAAAESIAGLLSSNNIDPVQSNPVVNTLPSNQSAIELTSSASSIYQTETMKVPDNVKTVVIYAANEFHEDWVKEKHKHISDKNPYFLPTNLVIANGTTVVVHNADAPWSTPHPHNFALGGTTSPKLPWGQSTAEFRLAPGNYKLTSPGYPWAVSNVMVSSTPAIAGSSLIVGTFYTPTKQVSDPKDDDGGTHPGNLAYFMQEFPKNGLKIESVYNFSYASCNYCPGKFWPDNKAANHTLIVWSSTQPLPNVLAALTKLTKANVYI